MDLTIPNSWLNKFLDTKASPNDIAKYLTLCGPSIERFKKYNDGDTIYSIEVTTNRIDTASVYGIAREAQAILPRFGIKAKLKNILINPKKFKFVNKVKYLDVKLDSKLCPRFTAVLIKNVTVKDSPKTITSLLEKVGVRPINNIVDVSNFIMHELGQPVHTFDYDKIIGSKMILRLSKKGEALTTLDGKTFELKGNDIVIEDGGKRLIDLCGIMGGENSAIDQNTKNVLLFVQVYDKHKIRQTSMSLAQRSEAAVLFEKGLDTELIEPAIISAIDMIENLSGGVSESEIIDIYKNSYKTVNVSTTIQDLERIIGIKLNKTDITTYLESLGFKTSWNMDNLKAEVPSFRANDIKIPEDIAEEIARIHGYHNLPNILMEGSLPKAVDNSAFKIEKNIKQTLKSLGGFEILNLSLVSKAYAGDKALKLKNPLGSDTEYLRTDLLPLLIKDINDNPQEKDKLHFFELSNIYIPVKNSLPDEQLTLGGIIKDSTFRENKGVVTTLLTELEINYQTKVEDGKNFLPNQRLSVYSDKKYLGEFGNLDNGLFYYNFNIEKLVNAKKVTRIYKDVGKFPPQIEDMTLSFPEKTLIGDVLLAIESSNKLISKAELYDTFKDNYTFRIWYLSLNKTLENREIEEVRNSLISTLNKKFGATVK